MDYIAFKSLHCLLQKGIQEYIINEREINDGNNRLDFYMRNGWITTGSVLHVPYGTSQEAVILILRYRMGLEKQIYIAPFGLSSMLPTFALGYSSVPDNVI